MDASTQQFMYRTFVVVLAGAILAALGFVFAVGWHQGDGEAVKIVEAFQPFLFGALAGICGLFGIHTAGQTIQAKYQSQQPTPIAQTPASAPASGL